MAVSGPFKKLLPQFALRNIGVVEFLDHWKYEIGGHFNQAVGQITGLVLDHGRILVLGLESSVSLRHRATRHGCDLFEAYNAEESWALMRYHRSYRIP